jgi:hypothetical protein
MTTFHRDLKLGRFIVRFSVGPRRTRWFQALDRGPRKLPTLADVSVVEVTAPGVSLRPYRPPGHRPGRRAPCSGSTAAASSPVFPSRTSSAASSSSASWASRSLLSGTGWRRGTPSPAAVEDAYAGLLWLFAHAAELGIDPGRIAIGGAPAARTSPRTPRGSERPAAGLDRGRHTRPVPRQGRRLLPPADRQRGGLRAVRAAGRVPRFRGDLPECGSVPGVPGRSRRGRCARSGSARA